MVGIRHEEVQKVLLVALRLYQLRLMVKETSVSAIRSLPCAEKGCGGTISFVWSRPSVLTLESMKINFETLPRTIYS